MKEINCFLEAWAKIAIFYKCYTQVILNFSIFPAIIGSKLKSIDITE